MLNGIAQNLKQIRIDKSIEKDRICTYLGISQSAYNRYETGLRTPDIDTLIKLTELFQCDLSDLILKKTDEELVPRSQVFSYRELRDLGLNDKLAHGLMIYVINKKTYEDLPKASYDKKLKFVYRADLLEDLKILTSLIEGLM